jgi:hypothetical protein
VRTRLPNLSDEEGEELLRAVETRRLKRYLGPMMKMCVGSSPLDDSGVEADLSWLNGLRNDLMHRAEACEAAEARRALRIVYHMLQFLNDNGAGLALPQSLRFWTEDPESLSSLDRPDSTV